MAKANQQQIIDTAAAQVTPEEQAAIAQAMSQLQDVAELGATMQQHPQIINAIVAAMATAGICVTASTVAQAVGVAAVGMTGSVLVGTAVFYGVIALAVGLLFSNLDLLKGLAAQVLVWIKAGWTKLKELASRFWNWIKECAAGIWNWFTGLFSSDETPVAA